MKANNMKTTNKAIRLNSFEFVYTEFVDFEVLNVDYSKTSFALVQIWLTLHHYF